MSAEALDPMDEQDAMAAEWEAALSQQRAPASEVIDTPAEQVAPASFTTFAPTSTNRMTKNSCEPWPKCTGRTA